jgi:hypothetical protein
MEKDHVLSVSNRFSNLRATDNSYTTHRYIIIKYIIPVSMVGDLLLIIKKQNHETRNPRNSGFYQVGSCYRKS